METERSISTTPPPRPNGPPRPLEEPHALGTVARDVIDHVTIIARDEVKIAGLSAKRYAEHLRRDVAPRAAYAAAAVALAALTAIFGLLAIFIGIAHALSSAAWAFAIYCAAFAVLTVLAMYLAGHPSEARRRPR